MKLLQSIMAICLMVCLMFSARTAAAEIRPGAMTLSPSIGGYVFDGDQDVDNALVYGLGLGYHFDMHWAGEAVFHYVNTELDTSNRNVDVYFYHMDLLYHFMPSEKLVPFVAAGLGGIVFDPDKVKTNRNFAANYGIGLKYFVAENIALRGDVRHIISFNDTENNFLYTVGITFLFGGEKAKETPRVVEVPKKVEKVVILVAEPKVEEKVKVAAAEPKIIILAFEDVHFDFDKSTLTPEAQAILKRNIQMLKDNPNAKVRIAGYTSASGTEDYNQKLSERRASVVQEYLIKEGIITPDRLTKIGYGEANPAMVEAAPKEIYSTAAKANMRVLFEIVVK